MQPITAIILAGERPGGDPLAREAGYPAKALIPLHGEPLVRRVAEAASQVAEIGSIRVLAQQPDLIAPALAGTGAAVGRSEATIAQTIRSLLADGATRLLVTTADNALVTDDMLSHFLAHATEVDVAVGLVERNTLLARFPESRRTWLRFRGGAYSGANLFWVKDAAVLPLLDLWAEVEQQRKRASAIIGMLGPALSIGVGLRLLSLDQAMARAGKRFGLDIRGVPLPFAEACIDIDKMDDLHLATAILAESSPVC
ncbi:nucleotidyltransferase family protein [Sphingomonas sp.]|uniref:nucleotidyltransferase family protein n=1 Tax=Sphingomonas sp. TaxID=28214 RepID=UPI002DE9FF9A|nr:nucleotidyltransferase family protein [Sphingomonas sp.]